ncbi:MAG: hypothetical protein WD000_04550 [Thermodesulfobacteriota bacterium]
MGSVTVVREKTTVVNRVTKLKAGTTAIITNTKVKAMAVMAIITSIVTIIVGTINTIGAMVIIMAATTTIIEDTTNLTDAGMDTTDHTDPMLTGMGTDGMLITHSPTIHMSHLQLI